MRILDLCCKQGGAGRGYADAGFEVVGVDIEPQPRYPYPFHQRDAIDFLRWHHRHFDAIHISPPCQRYTNAQRINKNDHVDLIPPTRELLDEIGLPYVIENVVGAPLRDPVMLCGGMFGLGTYRHRLFETNWPLTAPDHPEHTASTQKMGRRPGPGQMMHVVGNFSGVEQARKAMGIDWMTRDGLREAIPPAYAEHIGRQLAAHIIKQKESAA